MDSINVQELVERLGSDEDAVRKMAVFKLQSNIGDPSFADVFILEGGLNKLRYLTLKASGNTLAYSLSSFSRLLEVDKGWEYVNQDLIERVIIFFCYSLNMLSSIQGSRAGGYPPLSQHPPRSHVHPCLHCLSSLHDFDQNISARFIRLSSFEACNCSISPVFGDARQQALRRRPRAVHECFTTHQLVDARSHHQ